MAANCWEVKVNLADKEFSRREPQTILTQYCLCAINSPTNMYVVLPFLKEGQNTFELRKAKKKSKHLLQGDS